MRPLVSLVFCFSSIAFGQYVLQDDYMSSSFASHFNFFTADDPANGYVNYLNEADATSQGIYNPLNNGSVYLGVDHTNIASGRGRNSLRLESKRVYNHGLFILDLAHMPGGECGTWPGYWLIGPNSPISGEFDIIKGVHAAETNLMSLRTSAECSITQQPMSGLLRTSRCTSGLLGCSIDSSGPYTYATGFNELGGGVYATEWTSNAITVWYFSRSNIPSDITSGAPSPTNWGTPLAKFVPSCNLDANLFNQRLILNTGFCGDFPADPAYWALDGICSFRAATCEEFVRNNPGEFQDTHWLVNSLRVYQNPLLPTISTTSSYVTSTTNTLIGLSGPTTTTSLSMYPVDTSSTTSHDFTPTDTGLPNNTSIWPLHTTSTTSANSATVDPVDTRSTTSHDFTPTDTGLPNNTSIWPLHTTSTTSANSATVDPVDTSSTTSHDFTPTDTGLPNNTSIWPLDTTTTSAGQPASTTTSAWFLNSSAVSPIQGTTTSLYTTPSYVSTSLLSNPSSNSYLPPSFSTSAASSNPLTSTTSIQYFTTASPINPWSQPSGSYSSSNSLGGTWVDWSLNALSSDHASTRLSQTGLKFSTEIQYTTTLRATWIEPCPTGLTTKTTIIVTTHCSCTKESPPLIPMTTETINVPKEWPVATPFVVTRPAAPGMEVAWVSKASNSGHWKGGDERKTATPNGGVATLETTATLILEPSGVKSNHGVPSGIRQGDHGVPSGIQQDDHGVPSGIQQDDHGVPSGIQQDDHGVPAASSLPGDSEIPSSPSSTTWVGNIQAPASSLSEDPQISPSPSSSDRISETPEASATTPWLANFTGAANVLAISTTVIISAVAVVFIFAELSVM